ncbi:protein phtf isoform X2 [Pararge aegeria]|uniref:protein phtf isoform X2 n=1 Tax=Pararge aegeria TaxID=116150 RepID=UPI0019CF5AC7|nr:protein phtf isoform X2 [Pararge aegeria]
MKHLAAWYQKKISSYDKEEWETMVEQLLMRGTYRRRIVDFSSHARSYLIDVDLVRGSSFPKAKPTLAMRRVVWFALIRLLFLPALYQWWAQQTSPACAKFLLALWLLQVINISINFMAPASIDIDSHCWIVPLGLMIVLCIVHSQIVSTTELELARVRPRSQYRRKLPRYFRKARSDCDGGSGGGSAESGATSSQSKTPVTKPFKFRRRLPRTDSTDTGLRKRKKDLVKDAEPDSEPITKDESVLRTKAKDSDDEDYMSWKKPDATAPIVTFTPPPDDVAPASSFRYKPNILTKKYLEFLNGRQNLNRPMFADGDDGFESLNGYNSNGSDGDCRQKETDLQNKRPNREKLEKPLEAQSCPKLPSMLKDDNNDDVRSVQCENVSASAKENKEEEEKTVDADSDSAITTTNPNVGKRIGVRFRKSWTKKPMQHESSDDDFGSVKGKQKVIDARNLRHNKTGEESSYGSQSEAGHSDVGFDYTGDSSWDPFAILDPSSDTVKCTMWERGSTLRAELSAVDISWYVVARAERAMAAEGCMWAGIVMAALVALVTPAIKLVQVAIEQDNRSEEELQTISLIGYIPSLVMNYTQHSVLCVFSGAFGDNVWEVISSILSCILRFALSGLVFFLLAVAERAYKQRFLYAKLFSHLTSARRARKSELPHFRLNTVRNIKTWLSTRSYLRRRGPQRSVDVIVSAAFMLTLTLLACVSAQLLRDSVTLESGWLLEAMVWSCCLGIYLMRLITVGSNVNRKYRGCLSAILTEQINLHLAIEQRPESKEQLTVANNVLKLAADLLKELDSPFKISGICANHYLYTITKVVILSALSGVLSEMLGFKLKLHKIKIK